MSKPATVAKAAASVVALAVVLGVLALRDKRPIPAPPEEPDSVTEPAPAEPTTADVRPLPRLLPTSVAGPTVRAPAEPDGGKLLDEASLLARLHELAASDPPLSLELAREAVDRFPDSPNAPEFEWNVAKSLFNMQRIEEAKDEARIMLWKYPGNSFTGDVERHLLYPQPNPPDAP
jgi:hypothetical protein